MNSRIITARIRAWSGVASGRCLRSMSAVQNTLANVNSPPIEMPMSGPTGCGAGTRRKIAANVVDADQRREHVHRREQVPVDRRRRPDVFVPGLEVDRVHDDGRKQVDDAGVPRSSQPCLVSPTSVRNSIRLSRTNQTCYGEQREARPSIRRRTPSA